MVGCNFIELNTLRSLMRVTPFFGQYVTTDYIGIVNLISVMEEVNRRARGRTGYLSNYLTGYEGDHMCRQKRGESDEGTVVSCSQPSSLLWYRSATKLE